MIIRRFTGNIPLIIVLLLLVMAMALPGYGQIAINKEAVKPVNPDSADVEYFRHKNFWRPLAEVVGFNLALNAFDRYVLKAPGEVVTWASIKKNFRGGFKWDSDMLGTNLFLHPYHGGLYFNAGRSNGYNFWQSELFAIGGSLMWEMFMENEYPSTNDVIATPIGGAVVGEITFRASDAVLDDRTWGWQRAGREIAAFVISPMRGLNRIFTGRAWKRSPTRGRVFGVPPIALRVSLGPKATIFESRRWEHSFGASLQIDLEYGHRFEPNTMPYDYFTFSAELQAVKEQPLLTHFAVKGRLLGLSMLQGKKSHVSVGLFQHFDFYDSDTIKTFDRVPYKMGIPASLGGGVFYRYQPDPSWRFDCYAHANAVFLAGILSDHYWTNKRDYNWASGFSIKGGLNWVFMHNRMSFTISHEFYRLFTWKGYARGTDLSKVNYRTFNVMGDKSVASFNVTTARFDARIWKNIYGSLVFDNFMRSTNYRDFPHVKSSTQSLRAMISYKF